MESLEHIGENKCLKEIPGTLNNSTKERLNLKLEDSAAEEVHSGSIIVEVSILKVQTPG
jgi:hypothetical protein